VHSFLQWKINTFYVFWMRVCSHLLVVYIGTDLWPVRLYYIFPHCLINVRIKKRVFEYKGLVLFSLQIFSETFLILRRIEGDFIINIIRYSCNTPLFLLDLNEIFILSTDFRKYWSKNLMKILPIGVVLLADGYDEVNNHFPQFSKTA